MTELGQPTYHPRWYSTWIAATFLNLWGGQTLPAHLSCMNIYGHYREGMLLCNPESP